MNHIKKENYNEVMLPGRKVRTCIGKGAPHESTKMTFGYTTYSADCGPMEPHHHAEEIVYICDAKNGYVRFGPEKDQLGERIYVQPGETLHFPPLEWHVFGYDGDDGFIDILFFYGQVDNIRPEDNQR